MKSLLITIAAGAAISVLASLPARAGSLEAAVPASIAQHGSLR